MAQVDNVNHAIPRPGATPPAEPRRNEPQNPRPEDRQNQNQPQAIRQEQDRVHIQNANQNRPEGNRAAIRLENQERIRIPRPGAAAVLRSTGGNRVQEERRRVEEDQTERKLRETPALQAPPQNLDRINLENRPEPQLTRNNANEDPNSIRAVVQNRENRPPTVIEAQVRGAQENGQANARQATNRTQETRAAANRQTNNRVAQEQRANENNANNAQRNPVSIQTQRGRNVDRLI